MVDKAQAAAEFARARTLADGAARTGAHVDAYVNERDVAHLGPILAAARGRARRRPGAVAGSRQAAPRAPVYLLHGAGRQRDPGDRIGAAGAARCASAA